VSWRMRSCARARRADLSRMPRARASSARRGNRGESDCNNLDKRSEVRYAVVVITLEFRASAAHLPVEEVRDALIRTNLEARRTTCSRRTRERKGGIYGCSY
jgi:hypothetical protein